MQILIVTIGMSITLLQVCIHLYKMVYVCKKLKYIYIFYPEDDAEQQQYFRINEIRIIHYW